MDTSAKLLRRNGKWTIEITAERWVIEDILFDAERKISIPVSILISEDRYTEGGTTRFYVSEPVMTSIAITSDIDFEVALKDVKQE